MIALALMSLLLGQGEFKVEDLKGREVKIVAQTAKTGDAPMIFLRRRVAIVKGGVSGERFLTESLVDELFAFAEAGRDRWTAEVRAAKPGRYLVSLGNSNAQVWVTRSGFDGWDRETKTLRDTADELVKIATEIDKEPGSAVLARFARQLDQERAKLIQMATEFGASREALRDGVDRLRFHQDVLKHAKKKSGAVEVDDYGTVDKQKASESPSALVQVKLLPEFVTNEVTLKLVEEILLLLDDEEKPNKVVRWASKSDAFKAVKEGAEKFGATPALVELMKTLPADDADPVLWDGFLKVAKGIRAKLIQ